MKIAVVSDFDGTLTKKDVGDYLLLRFNLITQEELNQSYSIGIKVEEWMKCYFSRIKNISEDLIEDVIINEIEAREGFLDMVKFLENNFIPFEIVSGGVDLYIERFFKKYKVNINGYYGRFNNGEIVYNFLGNKTLSEFKSDRVMYYKKLGYITVFLGDSPNDYQAILSADVRFATLKLADILEKEKRGFFRYESFNEVLEVLNASISV